MSRWLETHAAPDVTHDPEPKTLFPRKANIPKSALTRMMMNLGIFKNNFDVVYNVSQRISNKNVFPGYQHSAGTVGV